MLKMGQNSENMIVPELLKKKTSSSQTVQLVLDLDSSGILEEVSIDE